MQEGALYKTRSFKDPKYVGDPLNAVRIFNEKEVDELMVLDIKAGIDYEDPDYALIERLACECRMPFTYGGGVRSVRAFERLVSLGVEKVAVSRLPFENPETVREASKRLGSQSVVAVIDVKKVGMLSQYDVVTSNGKVRKNVSPSEWASRLEGLGVGEIVVNSVDKDGKSGGYDHRLISEVKKSVSVPVTAVGGAGSLDDFRDLYLQHGLIGAAAGSFFVFKGKYRAVLINYPDEATKLKLVTGDSPV